MNEAKLEKVYELIQQRKEIDEQLEKLMGESPRRGRPPNTVEPPQT